MKRLLLLICCVLATPLWASHIVGGEFELTHVPNSNYLYNIRLILYFDVLNANPQAKDIDILVRIYRTRDNAAMQDIPLTLMPQFESRVDYFQPACANGSVVTDKFVYNYVVNGVVTPYYLDPNRYNDPQGYYLVWERCCRNYSITNIVSHEPDPGNNSDPNAAGQTFYLKFPPVVKDGQPFINSSPRLFPPLSDYACPRQYYYVDFAGTDDDGDSLVYSMVTPLNTHSSVAIPPSGPGAAPFDSVRWQSPFSATNIVGGAPDLRISKDGLLTVTPQFAGLYVFAVRCNEYRNGLKIGEVRRDFQLLVLQGCPQAEPPVIEGKPLNAPDDQYVKGNLTVSFPNTVSDDNRCIEVRVTDNDSKKPDDNNEEDIKLRVFPIGFKDKTVSDILPDISSATLINGSAATFNICFPQCPYHVGAYDIGVIAQDNACPLPRLDTIIITVNVQPPTNSPAKFQVRKVNQTVLEGAPSPTWSIIGTDVDLDTLLLYPPVPLDYNIFDYGFTYQQTKDEPGRVEAKLTWDTRCDVVDFSDRTEFDFRFLVDDKDVCKLNPPDTMTFHLKMDLYDFHSPVISIDPEIALPITKKMFESVNFLVVGNDADNDPLRFKGEGLIFSLGQYGATFPEATGRGHITSPFAWPLTCNTINLDEKSEFVYRFIVIDDQNRCHYYLADTVDVPMKIEPAENIAPVLSVSGNEPEYTLGETIYFDLLGTDADVVPVDKLHIELLSAEGTTDPKGYQFVADDPFGPHASLTWKPDCSIYENDVYKNDYTFTFRVLDDRCFNVKGDTLDVPFSVKDVVRDDVDFHPPNFISPNGDGHNDYFAMVRMTDHGLESILPKDNCTGVFVSIVIYNRWGRKVFESNDRDFKWYPDEDSSGVYYYTLTYTTKDYKGIISIRG